MPVALLLAMQAAGMVTDWFATQNQQRLGDMGLRVQQAGIESSIQQTRLETEDASLQAMQKLRQNLGTQIATFAARGTSTSAGSAVGILQESIGNFNTDERTRRMNLLGNVNNLKGQSTIAGLNQTGNNTKLWQSFAQRSLNRFPTSPGAYGALGKSFGLTEKA